MWRFPEVLVLSSSETLRDNLVATLDQCGMAPIPSATIAEGRVLLAHRNVCVVFCDDCLSDGTYHAFLTASGITAPEVPVIVVSPFGDWTEYLKALAAGAFDYVGVPLGKIGMGRILQNALVEHLQRKLESTHVH
jgi:DNA-binding NtrC family response regulator